MPWRDPPNVDVNDPEYQWPHWEFDMDKRAVFGTLHEQFNTTRMFIQEPRNFLDDVREIARGSKCQREFFSRLEIRKNERLAAIREAIKMLDTFELGGHYDEMSDRQRLSFSEVRQKATLDLLVGFFFTFASTNSRGQPPRIGMSPKSSRSG